MFTCCRRCVFGRFISTFSFALCICVCLCALACVYVHVFHPLFSKSASACGRASTYTPPIRYDHYMIEFSLFSIHATIVGCLRPVFWPLLLARLKLVSHINTQTIYIVLQQFKFSCIHCCVCVFLQSKCVADNRFTSIVIKCPINSGKQIRIQTSKSEYSETKNTFKIN